MFASLKIFFFKIQFMADTRAQIKTYCRQLKASLAKTVSMKGRLE